MDILQYLEGGGLIWGAAAVGVFFLLIAILKTMIRVTSPDQILVVTGRKRVKNGKTFGFSVERGRTFKVPYFQSVGGLDLGVYPVSVRLEGVNSANGITVGADATACVCVDDDDEGMLYSAVERLMGKDRKQIGTQVQQTLVGNFRGALNKATPLQAIGMEDTSNLDTLEENLPQQVEQGERAQFRIELLKDCNSDLSSFGMKVVSVSLQKIWDTSNYIANLAQKTLARKRQDVEIEESRLRALAAQAESDSERRISIAKSQADEKILAAREKVEVYRRESIASIEQARLEAENAIAGAENRGQRDVQEQLVELQKLRNRSRVTLEASSREKAARIRAEGEKESTRIREEARNLILKKKVDLLVGSGDSGRMVLFIQEQLPQLFERWKEHAAGISVDSLIVMDEETGFNGAVNRGPAAFADFLSYFRKALGIDIRTFLASGSGGDARGGGGDGAEGRKEAAR